MQHLALLYERAPHDAKPSAAGRETGQVSVAVLAVRVLAVCCCLTSDDDEWQSGKTSTGADELGERLASSARTTLADILAAATALEGLVAGRVLQVALPAYA